MLYLWVVKIVHFLFSFYFFLLPFFPCSDAYECKEATAISATINPSTDHEHHHEKESCSPFCFCSCCGQVIVTGFQLFKSVCTRHAIAHKQSFRIDHHSIVSGFHNNVWQPPKTCWSIFKVYPSSLCFNNSVPSFNSLNSYNAKNTCVACRYAIHR